jgi:hypothetical protein
MSGSDEAAARRALGAAQLRQQAVWCRELGSELYAQLLHAAAADCDAGGPTWEVIAGHEDMWIGDALPIRVLGAVHRLVLEGRAPELARYYASAGGAFEAGDDVWPAFRDLLVAQRGELREGLLRPVQTNEVARSASLLGGFATIARETELPLRLFEVGASAGLNLRFDRFHYESPGFAWGDPASPVRLGPVFEGAAPALAPSIEVSERTGCDASPIDPCSAPGRLTLRSFVWPDQRARRARLDAALEIAARVPARVERADACDWIAGRLAPEPGVASVVYHSIVMGYLGRERMAQFAGIVRAAGATATPQAPIAWLCLEPGHRRDDGGWDHLVFLTLWPGGERRVLAESSPHGPPVRWLGA